MECLFKILNLYCIIDIVLNFELSLWIGDKIMVGKKRLEEILNNFSNARIAVVGDVMLDDYIFGSVDRISPEAPVPVVNVKKETFVLGGAAEVLNNLNSIHGALLRMNRSIQSEGTFGTIKWNRSYIRARRRGLKSLFLEFGMISCGFNLHKLHLKRMAFRSAA